MRRSTKVELTKLPWRSRRGTLEGRAIAFVERYLILPETRQPMVVHRFQADLFEQWASCDVKAHISVCGAGNAKTTTLAAYATALLYTEEEQSIPIVAETVTQAVLTTWGRMKRFVELSPDLECRSEILEGQGSRRGIYVPGTNGHAFPIADNPAGLQGLNPSLAVLEETSEATIETFSALMNRLGKRPGTPAKVVGITTPSFTPNNALLQIQSAIQSGDPMPGVRLTEFVSDQKDHRDERQWPKANPGLLTAPAILGIDSVRSALAVLPEQQFRCYRLAQNPTGSLSCWLNAVDDDGDEIGDAYEVWRRGAHPTVFVEGAPTFLGVDVSKTRDSTAVVRGQFLDDGRLATKAKIWTPTKTAAIDLEELADHLREQCGRYDVRGIGYDPAYFSNAVALANEGLPMVETPQTDVRMAPIVGATYAAIRRGEITHDGDDALYTRHVLAARRRYCSRGFTLEKMRYSEKIDAAVALCLCNGVASGMQHVEEVLDLSQRQIY